MNETKRPGLNVSFEDGGLDLTHDASRAAFFSFDCQRNTGRRHRSLPIAGRVGEKRDPSNMNGGVAQWDWDGDMQTPSFTPSIHCTGCCHGYITRGAWDDRRPG